MLAVLSIEIEDRRVILSRRLNASLLAAAFVVALPAATLATGGRFGPYVYQTLMAVACSFLLAFVVIPSAAGSAGSHFRRLLEARWMFALGLVSYSLFLWHEPLVHLLRERGLTAPGIGEFLIAVVTIAAVSIPLSIITYRLVERPALRRKRR